MLRASSTVRCGCPRKSCGFASAPQRKMCMSTFHEAAPRVFRIATSAPGAALEFGQFLVRDDEPLLFETGMKALFPAVREAVAKVLDPSTIRWVSFSHFEADECGALNEW